MQRTEHRHLQIGTNLFEDFPRGTVPMSVSSVDPGGFYEPNVLSIFFLVPERKDDEKEFIQIEVLDFGGYVGDPWLHLATLRSRRRDGGEGPIWKTTSVYHVFWAK